MKMSHIIVGLIVIAVAYFGYQYWQKNKAGSVDTSKKEEVKTPTPAPAASAAKFEGDDNTLSEVLGA